MDILSGPTYVQSSPLMWFNLVPTALGHSIFRNYLDLATFRTNYFYFWEFIQCNLEKNYHF